MKKYLVFLLIVSLSSLSCKKKGPGDTQPTDGKYEAEDALISSTNSLLMTTIAGFSGTGYVGGFYNATDYVTFELENIVAGRFDLFIEYSTSNFGAKVCNVDVNGTKGSFELAISSAFTMKKFATVVLKTGSTPNQDHS